MVNFIEYTKILLAEKIDIEKTFNKFGDILYKRIMSDRTSPINFKQENTKSFIKWLANDIDPTSNHEYTLWLILRYIKKINGNYGIQQFEDFLSKAKPYLEMFHKLKRKQKFKAKYSSDINQYKTLSDLGQAVLEFQEQAVSKRGEEEELIKNNEVDILYNGEDLKVVIPKTAKASCYYGRNTQWCTAAENNNLFQNYYEEGPLYIVIHKPTNRRYQFHFPTEQYMDENDQAIHIIPLIKKYPVLIRLIPNINYYGKNKWQIENKWFDDDGKLHREDGPALIVPGDGIYWYEHGILHNDTGPAQIILYYKSYGFDWFQNGKLHREDGPASLSKLGVFWYQNNQTHRSNGPAVIEETGNGWFLNDEFYKRPDNGPNSINTGINQLLWYDKHPGYYMDGLSYVTLGSSGKRLPLEKWYKNHELHREDGPALISRTGGMMWYINGKEIKNGPYYMSAEGELTYKINGKEYTSFETEENLKKYGHFNDPKKREQIYNKWTSKEYGFETLDDYNEQYNQLVNKYKHYIDIMERRK